MTISASCAGFAALGLGLAAVPATAAIVSTTVGADIATVPFTITFQPGETLSFSDVTGATSVTEAAIGVRTTGGAEVFSAGGLPVYFQTFATSLFPSEQGGAFASYQGTTGVPYSIAQGLVGFEYVLGDGTHFGVADIGGSTVYHYYLDTVPGQSFSLGVPEPSTWAMLLGGLGLAGAAMRRKNRIAQVV